MRTLAMAAIDTILQHPVLDIRCCSQLLVAKSWHSELHDEEGFGHRPRQVNDSLAYCIMF